MKDLSRFRKIALPVLIFSAFLAAFLISACGGGGGGLTISPDKLPQATAGQPYQATITVTGNKTPVGFIGIESGALPAGLEIHYKQIENTATIEGMPQATGTFKFTINTWCMGTNQPGQTALKDYELVVK